MKRRWRLWVILLFLAGFSVASLLVLGDADRLARLRGWPPLDDPTAAFAEPVTWPRLVLDEVRFLSRSSERVWSPGFRGSALRVNRVTRSMGIMAMVLPGSGSVTELASNTAHGNLVTTRKPTPT